MCDDLTIAPWGDLILCEGNCELNHLRGIRPDGTLYTFATNTSSKSEMAGVVFSPSGKTLFVNIQDNGETLAVTAYGGKKTRTANAASIGQEPEGSKAVRSKQRGFLYGRCRLRKSDIQRTNRKTKG